MYITTDCWGLELGAQLHRARLQSAIMACCICRDATLTVPLVALFLGWAEVNTLLTRDAHHQATDDAQVVRDESKLRPVVDATLSNPVVDVEIHHDGTQCHQNNEELWRVVLEVAGQETRGTSREQGYVGIQYKHVPSRNVAQERSLVLGTLIQDVRGKYEVDTNECFADASHLRRLLPRCVQDTWVEDEEASHANHPVTQSHLVDVQTMANILLNNTYPGVLKQWQTDIEWLQKWFIVVWLTYFGV